MNRLLVTILYLCINTGCKPGGATESVVNIWHPYEMEVGDDFQDALELFEESHPDMDVRALYATNNLSSSQKLFLSIAGGVPPDVTFVDGPQVAEWACLGALEPLDDFISEAGIREEDFWGPCWKQTVFDGRVYALTINADPNFGFFWNKKVFREAGLDPEQPPRTLDEMDRMAERLTIMNNGRLDKIGIVPWMVYGKANSLFTWGWAFGGRFFDYDNNKVTADHPGVVRALEWMRAYAEEYDIRRVSSLASGFGTAEQNPFFTGRIAMQPMIVYTLQDIERYSPDLDFGVTVLPQPEGGEYNSSWVGGWCLAIPRGARNPEGAFRVIKWLCTSPEGTTLVSRTLGSTPGYRKSPYLEEAGKDPRRKSFIEILENSKHQRPVMPAQAFYMGELERAVDDALYGKKTPAEALRDARFRTQEGLDRIMERYHKRKSREQEQQP
jgi:multiple sugar transport system substrate-binding protein